MRGWNRWGAARRGAHPRRWGWSGGGGPGGGGVWGRGSRGGEALAAGSAGVQPHAIRQMRRALPRRKRPFRRGAPRGRAVAQRGGPAQAAKGLRPLGGAAWQEGFSAAAPCAEQTRRPQPGSPGAQRAAGGRAAEPSPGGAPWRPAGPGAPLLPRAVLSPRPAGGCRAPGSARSDGLLAGELAAAPTSEGPRAPAGAAGFVPQRPRPWIWGRSWAGGAPFARCGARAPGAGLRVRRAEAGSGAPHGPCVGAERLDGSLLRGLIRLTPTLGRAKEPPGRCTRAWTSPG